MFFKPYHTKLPDGTNVKFTIRERIIDGKVYHCAHVINTDMDSYINATELEKETSFLGMDAVGDWPSEVELFQAIKQKYGIELIG